MSSSKIFLDEFIQSIVEDADPLDLPIGDELDCLFKLRGRKQELGDLVKKINSALEQIEENIIEKMNNLGIDKIQSTFGSGSIKVGTYPSVSNVQDFYRWVVEVNRFEFVQARANSGPVNEMLEQENSLPPGISVYTRSKLNVRKKTGL